MLQRRRQDEIRVPREMRVLAVDAGTDDGDHDPLAFGAKPRSNTSGIDRLERSERHVRKLYLLGSGMPAQRSILADVGLESISCALNRRSPPCHAGWQSLPR